VPPCSRACNRAPRGAARHCCSCLAGLSLQARLPPTRLLYLPFQIAYLLWLLPALLMPVRHPGTSRLHSGCPVLLAAGCTPFCFSSLPPAVQSRCMFFTRVLCAIPACMPCTDSCSRCMSSFFHLLHL